MAQQWSALAKTGKATVQLREDVLLLGWLLLGSADAISLPGTSQHKRLHMIRGTFNTNDTVNDLLNKAEAIAAEGNDLYFTDEFGQDWVLRKLDPLIKKREPFTKEKAIALIELIMKGD